jgi:hypothetical protein
MGMGWVPGVVGVEGGITPGGVLVKRQLPELLVRAGLAVS